MAATRQIPPQSRWTIDRWARPAERIPATPFSLSKVSASTLYQSSRAALPPPPDVYARTAQSIFNTYTSFLGLTGLDDVADDGYEFWTVVDAWLCLYQELYPGADLST